MEKRLKAGVPGVHIVQGIPMTVLEVLLDRLAIVSVAAAPHHHGILHDLHRNRAQELPHTT